MDFLFISGITLLWGAVVLMIFGFKKLEKPELVRP